MTDEYNRSRPRNSEGERIKFSIPLLEMTRPMLQALAKEDREKADVSGSFYMECRNFELAEEMEQEEVSKLYDLVWIRGLNETGPLSTRQVYQNVRDFVQGHIYIMGWENNPVLEKLRESGKQKTS